MTKSSSQRCERGSDCLNYAFCALFFSHIPWTSNAPPAMPLRNRLPLGPRPRQPTVAGQCAAGCGDG
jgi:hypothetical protein